MTKLSRLSRVTDRSTASPWPVAGLGAASRKAAGSAFLLLVLLAACTRPPVADRLTLEPTDFRALPGWEQDEQQAALDAFLRSCAILVGKPPETPLGIAGTAADWRQPCAAAAAQGTVDKSAARGFFETWFAPYKASNNGESDGLFTGYYEPELRGARQPSAQYVVPLLRRPPDLVMVELGRFRPAWRGERIAGRVRDGRLEPYEDRLAIEHGALDRYGLAFLWVDDPVDAFFLQVQGSGRVRLADGSLVRVGYDAQNGHPYVPIGRLLAERKVLDKDAISMQAIRDWIKANPEPGAALMDENPSYVFFREIDGDGPIGTEGAVLTPGRSLAVDRDFVSLGVPIWLDAEDGEGRLQRLLVAQDTGGAIRGPVRADVFWGAGPEAASRAGNMKARGEYYLLLPKGLAITLAVAGPKDAAVVTPP
jgi:membrane-bound lytic murein transglycosylase A